MRKLLNEILILRKHIAFEFSFNLITNFLNSLVFI